MHAYRCRITAARRATVEISGSPANAQSSRPAARLIFGTRQQELATPTMAEPTSAYLTLGVDRAASDEDIRAAFKRLAVKWHPDKGGDPSKFAQLREAYDTLADVDRRAAHDREFRLHGGDAAGLRDAGTAAQSGSEMDMVRRFREGEFAGHDPTLLQANSGAAGPTNLGFGAASDATEPCVFGAGRVGGISPTHARNSTAFLCSSAVKSDPAKL